MDALTFSKFRLKPRVLCIIRYVVRGVVWYEWFPCSPTSTDSIYTIKLVLDQWIYDETYVKKIGLKIGPILIWLWLSGMHLCWFLTWMHKLGPLSHMRLRARDCCTSSTLIGGKDGAGPSSLLHTTLEGPTEYVNARWWMWSLHGFLHGIKWIMFHDHLDYCKKPPLGGRPHTKLGAHGTLDARNLWFILFYHVWGPTRIDIHWNSIWLRTHSHMTSRYTWGPMTTLHDFGGVLGRPLDTFIWALTISWS